MKLKPHIHNFFRNRKFSVIFIFLAGMTAMTVISRAADSFMIPQVSVTSPEEMKLQYPLEIQGRIVPEKTFAVYCPQDLRIAQVQIQKNDIVQKGDLLFSADLKELQEKIRQTEQELQKLDLQIGDLESSRHSQARQHDLDLTRAKEDYNDTLAESDASVNAAYLELEQAQNELALHNSQKPEEYTSSARTEETHVSEKRTGLSEETDVSQVSDLSEETDASQVSVLPEETDASQVSDLSEEENTPEAWNRKREELEQLCQEKQKLYEEAVAARNKALKTAARQIEDASLPLTEDHSAILLQADRENLNRTLQELKELNQTGGRIYSEYDGQISECTISTGSLTSWEPAVILTDFSQSFRFEGTLSKTVSDDDISNENTGEKTGTSLLEEKAECTLRMEDGSILPEPVKITDIARTEDGSCRITANLDSLEISRPGEAVLELTGESRTWPCCIPLSAIYSRESGDFVLRVREDSTILGVQFIAECIPVTLLEQNSQYAAVEGSLSPSDRIIVNASKTVKEGDRIRIIED